MKNKILILVIVFLQSCSVTKKHSYTERELQEKLDSVVNTNIKIQKDTILRLVKEIVKEPVETIIEIPIECDSVGNVKPVNYKYKSNNNTLKAQLKNNRLIIHSKTDSLRSVIEKELKYKYRIDSVYLYENAINKYKKTTEETTIKQKSFFVLHLKCLLTILLLLLVVFYLIKKKL